MQSISSFLGSKDDLEKLKEWVRKTNATLPDPEIERKRKMAHVPSEGKGIFSPQTKKTNPAQPDWKGQIMVNGETIRFSGWMKKSQYGEFMSLAVDRPFEPKEPKPRNQQSYPKEVEQEYDGEIPW